MILDLNKKEHLPMINTYKKCKGIALVDRYLHKLSPLNKMYVINSMEDWKKVENEFPIQMMTTRCDCPKGINGKLPNGQTFNRDRVREYIETAKERALFLIKAFPDRKDEILETIPKRYNGISRQIFRDVREQVIFPSWLQHEQLSKDGLRSFGVEVNIVEDGTLVPMEIQVPDRFKEKEN